MATRGPLGASDADFREDQFADAYATDLVNTVGNGASRVTAMAERYFEGSVPRPEDPHRIVGDRDWNASIAEALREAESAAGRFAIDRMAEAGLSLFRSLDGFIHRTEPFRLAKDPDRREDLARILHQSLEVLFAASALLWPLMPDSMDRLREALGCAKVTESGPLADQVRMDAARDFDGVRKIALFPRIETA
jgi:methionyl-tRNA synthetase